MSKTRDHGQGALYYVPRREMWKVVVDIGFDPVTGRRRQKGLFSKTKDGAVKKLNSMLRERDSLGIVLDRSTRVEQLADRWLKDIATRAKPHTLANYRSIVGTKVVPTLGRRKLTDLTPTDVRRMHAAIRKTGLGDSSVSGAHRTLVTMLEYAKSERLIAENVAMLTPPRRVRPGKAKDSLSRNEATALLETEDARWTVGLLTGIRSGEARALRRQDLDLENGVAEVSWSLTEATFAHGCGGTCGKKRAGNCPSRAIELSDDLEWIHLEGRHILVRPKNDTPRQVPLTVRARAQLRRHLERDDQPNPHELVWHRATGSPKTNDDDNDDLRAALVRAGVDQPAATTHWLRHSYVTLSENAGIPWAASAGVSGHGSPEASDPYRHVLTAEGRRAVDTLELWLGATNEGKTDGGI